MANSKTEHSKKLRAETARKSAQKIIDEGGMRVNLLLEVQHAVRFKQLMEQEGSQKKAFVALLSNAVRRRKLYPTDASPRATLAPSSPTQNGKSIVALSF